MRNTVTVVPSDRLIIVDGAPLVFDFAAPPTLRALQWRDGAGTLEWTDDYPWTLDPDAYDEEVAPWVALWDAENTRREREAADAATREKLEYDSPAARARRLRDERDKRLRDTDYLLAADYPLGGAQRVAVMAYRQELRDLTDLPGFPWLGGGPDDPECPWPAPPNLKTVDD